MKCQISTENKATKIGYERIKQKVKDVRQDYRKAVTEGRRSGSGKLVCENWDQLKTLWGGWTIPQHIRSMQKIMITVKKTSCR